MTSVRAFHVVAPVALLAACTQARDFQEHLAATGTAVAADTAEARRCADELHAIAHRSPRAAGSALELQNSPTGSFVVPPLAVSARAPGAAASRFDQEIARRERVLLGVARVLTDARTTGPAARERVWGAAEQAHRVRLGLCQAVDVASTLAALDGRGPDGLMSSR